MGGAGIFPRVQERRPGVWVNKEEAKGEARMGRERNKNAELGKIKKWGRALLFHYLRTVLLVLLILTYKRRGICS